jgi:hypothetical protein
LTSPRHFRGLRLQDLSEIIAVPTSAITADTCAAADMRRACLAAVARTYSDSRALRFGQLLAGGGTSEAGRASTISRLPGGACKDCLHDHYDAVMDAVESRIEEIPTLVPGQDCALGPCDRH